MFLFAVLHATALILLSDNFLLCEDDMGDLGKIESAFAEGSLHRRQISSGIFQRPCSSGTSEVIRHAFSDDHVVLPLSTIWLVAAFFFFFFLQM